jgi:flagellar biosynthesis anti-sigma factor FlgM
MGIDGIQGKRDKLQIEQEHGQKTNAGGRPNAFPIHQEDQVQFSSETQEFLRIRNMVDAAPDIRQDLVDELRRQISQGAYHVPSSDIAEAILDTWV